MTGILLVDKPEEWTSSDVVCKLRGVLHERRIGHSGTLDPMATGLLPVFVGKATKAVEYAENQTKRYLAGLRLGMMTDTLDITGNIISKEEVTVSDSDVLNVFPFYTGKIKQIPPMYSAVKINGKKLYQMARNGKSVEREARDIEIFSLSLLGKNDAGDYLLDILCSKGTYIRSLCDDIGKSIGCGGCMSSLRRIQCGSYSISDAVPLTELISESAEEIEKEHLIPVDSLFEDYPAYIADEADTVRLKQGNTICSESPSGLYRVYSEKGDFLLLSQVSNGVMKQIKSFYEV